MNREIKIKIIGTGIFITLLLGVAYLVYHSNGVKSNAIIRSVSLTGNNLLNESDYLAFTKLTNLENNNHLTLQVVKSRFEKHPYVLNAEVKFENERSVKVFLTEKKIYGVIIKNDEALLAAENFQMLPVFQNTKMIDIPVLSNVQKSDELEPLKKISNEDILQAYKILDASGLTNAKMIKELAEINLRNGGDVILTFSGLSIPVIFGRHCEAGKIVALEALLNNYLVNNAGSDYIDLRFYNDIYIGHLQRAEL